MHIPPFENKNIPIVDVDDSRVPLNYFNIVNLKRDQLFEFIIPGYETCIVPATGTIDIQIEGIEFNSIGKRTNPKVSLKESMNVLKIALAAKSSLGKNKLVHIK